MNKKLAEAGVMLLVLSSGITPVMLPDDLGYDLAYNSEKSYQSLIANGIKQGATRGMGIYIPNMAYPVEWGTPVSSIFGYRDAPCPSCSTNHEGIDFNPGNGSPVYSATDGIVVWVGWKGSLGYHVVIQDAGTWQLYYGHMIDGSAPADVAVGSRVQKGQRIGLVGNTGQSTGAHLHFAIQDGGVFIDPLPMLEKYAS